MFEKPDKPDLQATIDELFENMQSVTPDSEEYAKMAVQLERIYKLKEVDSKRKIDPNQVIGAAATFLGILWITRYERENVITSKALSFITSFRP